MNSQSAGHVLIETNIYLASLVSTLEAVNSLLDPLRRVTANIPASAELTQKQQTALENIRKNLETYLTKEEARIFSADSLLPAVSALRVHS